MEAAPDSCPAFDLNQVCLLLWSHKQAETTGIPRVERRVGGPLSTCTQPWIPGKEQNATLLLKVTFWDPAKATWGPWGGEAPPMAL